MYGFPLARSGIAQPLKSGFLQIPPHNGHPCFWLTLPAARRIRNFHPIERALTERTKSTVILVSKLRCLFDKEPS